MVDMIAGVVETMRKSSMDDQRFVVRIAPKINMTEEELKDSIDESLSRKSGDSDTELIQSS